MNSATHFNVTNKPLHYAPAKSLGSSLSGSQNVAAPNRDLGAWLEEAYVYRSWLQGVLSGQVELKPGEERDVPQDPQAYLMELDNQIRWAMDQMGAGAPAWDPMANGGEGYREPAESDPFGAIPGAMNNLVHNEEKARVGFTGNETRDFWSDDIVIDVAPLSAIVTAEPTTDSRWQPPENVLKVTVKDPATGTEAVYYVHDYENAQVKIRTPREAQVNGQPADLVTWEKFTPAGAQIAATVESAIQGVEQADGSFLYGEAVAFQSRGSGVSGEVQRHDVYGNADITVLGHDEVSVRKNRNILTGEEPGTFTVTVTHRDGSKDVYLIHAEQGYTANLNANPGQVTWEETASLIAGRSTSFPANLGALPIAGAPDDDAELAEEEAGVPDAFQGTFTLNGTAATAGSGTWRASAPVNSSDAGLTDTAPTRVEETDSGQKAIYDNPADEKIEIHTSFADDVDEHHVSTAGTVDIYTESNTDKVFIKKVDDTYTVIIYKRGITDPNDPNFQTETYVIEGNPSRINVHALPNNVHQYVFGQYGWINAGNPVDTYDEGDAYVAGSVSKIKVSNEGPAWPGGEILENIPTGGASTAEANALIQKINDAIRSGEWHEVTDYLATLDAGTANNVVRKIITAIYEAAVTDEAFLELMQNIPYSVRNEMKDTLSFEPEEIQDGDNFNSAATAEKISATLDY